MLLTDPVVTELLVNLEKTVDSSESLNAELLITETVLTDDIRP